MAVNINLFDYLNAAEIAAYVTDKPENKIPYFAETLFPAKKQLGTDISWLKGSNGLPIAIQPSNYDAKARMREKEGFKGVSTDMAFFREAMRIGEKDRQQLNLLLAHPQSQIAMPLITKIFDEAGRLVEGVRVQAEIMRMQLLTNGKINVTSADGRAQYVYDYGQKNKFFVDKLRDVWGADKPNADPVLDIIAWQDDMEGLRGIRPSRLIMNRNTFLKMVRCPKMHKMMYPDDSTGNKYVSEAEVKTFIEGVTGCSIFIYSKKVSKLDHDTGLAGATPVNLIEDDVICLLPTGSLGMTYYGTTPEESDLMTGTDASVALVNNGTAVTTYKEVHPVNVVTIVSAVMIPSFEAIDDCAICNINSKGTNGIR
ncbi:MAG: major capsid protein [Bacilli bacterium]